MKTKREFDNMAVAFGNAIDGKSGDAFMIAALAFMNEQKFESLVVTRLHEDRCGNILFFSDHPMNDVGFIFVEIYDKQSYYYVGTKTHAHMTIQRARIAAKLHRME